MTEIFGAVAIGSFDGVHSGHLSVIDRAVSYKEFVPRVFTFSSDSEKPACKDGLGCIFSEDQKREYILARGIKEIISPDFSSVKNLSGEEFFERILLGECHAKVISCGENFRFGKCASCGTDELRAFCDAAGVKLDVLPLSLLGGEPISSSRIRAALLDGNIPLAAALLGHPYIINETVVHGNKLGRALDFPTINQILPAYRLIPKRGVYASFTMIGGAILPSVTNIGCKPTVCDRADPVVETHIIGFDGDLYGQKIAVKLMRFIRPERKFSSVEELKAQIAQDSAACGAI